MTNSVPKMAAGLIIMKVIGLATVTNAFTAYSVFSEPRRESGGSDSNTYDTRPVNLFKAPVPSFKTDNQGMGTVSGVAVDSQGDLFVFHRADRPWDSKTFKRNTDVLSETGKRPIQKETIYKLNPDNGTVIRKLGGNLFHVPHGLTIDSNDNLWMTDVGLHQVIRIPRNSSVPDLVLGEEFVPGNDDSHFCKPTDVAVASNGDFFVSDGYCNSRIVKFSRDGQYITQWGISQGHYELDVFSLYIPHSIALVEELDMVCVADREHQRALCYNAGLKDNRASGMYNRTIIPAGDMGKIFAIYYNKADRTLETAVEISRTPYRDNGALIIPPRATTYSLDGQQLDSWAYITEDIASLGPSLIHDLCTSNDGNDFFLGDVVQPRVMKYSKQSVVVG